MWTNARRVGFRFGFALAALWIYPFPIGFIPKTETFGEWLGKPIEWLVVWVAETILGLPTPATAPTGSGDTTFAWVQLGVIIVLAAIAALIWSLADRRSTSYPRLAGWTVIGLRYVLGIYLLSYGISKVVPSQFPSPSSIRLDERIGDMSPMGMLWTFMGSSPAYTRFAGGLEMLGGLLLLSHRLHVLGAAVTAGVMLNVVMLNVCYDVPVKQFSMQLLIIALILLAPHVRRLLAAFIAEARERGRIGHERARLAVKIAMLGVIVYSTGDQGCTGHDYISATIALEGSWAVDRFVEDGTEHPPLATDTKRWRRFLVAAVSYPHAAITHYSGNADDQPVRVDPYLHTIVFGDDVWRYSQPDDAHLVIDGHGVHGVHDLHVELHRDGDPLLVSRGFHWVQERPFNR